MSFLLHRGGLVTRNSHPARKDSVDAESEALVDEALFSPSCPRSSEPQFGSKKIPVRRSAARQREWASPRRLRKRF